MADNQATSSKKNPAQQTLDRFNAWWSYCKQNHHARWSRNRKLYNNIRVSESYKGLTDTFVPLTYSTVETLVAALGAGRPSTDFTPNDMYAYVESYAKTGKKPDTKALNATYDWYWDNDNWDLKNLKTIRGGLIEGIAGEWYYWDAEFPRIINLQARDIIVDPNAKDPMDLLNRPKDYYGGRRFMTTISALKSERIVDPENPGKTKRRYVNLDKITPGFTGDKETDKTRRDMFTGAHSANSELVEVIEIWDGTNIRSIANRSGEYCIEDRKNEVGIIPLGLTRFIADEDVIVGKSIIDPIAQSQELLNDVTNQSVDAVTDILTPRWELDPAYSDHIATVTESKFGTVFPFTPGSLRPIDKHVVTNGAFNERQNMKDEIREATGAESIIQGGQQDGGATATEINAQVAGAGQRFELFVRMFEKEGLYQRATICFYLMLHYQKKQTLIPTTTADGAKFHVLNPSEFDKRFKPRIQLQATVDRQKMQKQNDYTKSYQMLIQDPTNDLWEAKKIMYPKMVDMSEEELDRVIGKENPAKLGTGEGLPADGSMGDASTPMDVPLPEDMPPEEPVVEPVQPADLVRLYTAAVQSGDADLQQQVKIALGFSAPEEPVEDISAEEEVVEEEPEMDAEALLDELEANHPALQGQTADIPEGEVVPA